MITFVLMFLLISSVVGIFIAVYIRNKTKMGIVNRQEEWEEEKRKQDW